jgi:DNA polymerase-1
MADLSGVRLEFVDSVEKAGQLMSWLGERRPDETLGVDLETGEYPGNPKEDAFSPWHGQIRLAQIGDGMTGWAIPWERWGGVFEEAFNKFEGNFLIHNSAFDTRWLTVRSGLTIPWHRTHDSMIASRIVSPTESAALKRLTSKYVDRRAAALSILLDDKMRDNGWTWGTVPITLKEYWSYGALDTVLSVRIWEKLGPEVTNGGEFAEVYDLEMGVRRICTQMELNGSRVNVEYSEKMYEVLMEHVESIKTWADKAYGINLNSTKQLVTFFQKYGVEITEFTPGGSPKADKVQLQKIQRDYPGEATAELAEQVLISRKYEKLCSSYFKNFINMNIDGLLHPSIDTLAARTGRMSIKEPALQTLPKGDKLVRRAFIPRTEDEIIMSCDLEQVEARVFASLSKDVGLIDLFNRCDSTGGDFFTEIGRETYREPGMVKSDPRRQLLKNMMYGRLYGAGITKMALTAGVKESQMKDVNDSFDAQFPGMKNMMRQVEDLGMRRLRDEGEAYIVTATGRKLPADEKKVYTLVNYLIQGTSAEILKINLLKMDAAGLTDMMVVPVHDEIVLSVPKTDMDEIAPIVQECMTTRDGWTVPLLAGVCDIGERWGDMRPIL